MSTLHGQTPGRRLPDPEDAPTVPLWPDAGMAIGLSRSATYDAARRGDIPGLIKVGGKLVVATAALRRALHLDEHAA